MGHILKEVRRLTIINKKNKVVVANIQKADTFFKRFAGLLGRKELPAQTGLLITPCKQVHSLFMRFLFDAIFLTEDYCVAHLVPSMKPFKLSPLVRDAAHVLEVPEGTIQAADIKINDRLLVV